MRYRVTFTVPSGTSQPVAQLLVQGTELEADTYEIHDGRLWFGTDGRSSIVEYAPGVWRSVAAVGAYTEATKPLPKETPGEDPGRRKEIR